MADAGRTPVVLHQGPFDMCAISKNDLNIYQNSELTPGDSRFSKVVSTASKSR